ncbi:general stress protein 26 [Microbacterium ginsengiterrae]|uniref:General stress protein 26 n=1 Tax=Microbacterium ginsengiterrae TaxID=546115 RepID=A0A7W9CDW3_9MICO|nr:MULTISPECIES: pyridoxamine 5'-phosphate oxidase family protein [Microbacterium]MBB5743828.1 general stress protein 26 [Microbacterium ginsengiterrae]
MSTDDSVRTVLEKTEKAGVCMLTTAAADGRIVSRPMAIQEIEADHSIWFMTRVSTPKVQESIGGRPVNVTVAEKGFWASIAGTATVRDDPERKKRYWSKATEAFFGDAEPEDADIVLLRVDPETAEYWDSPGLPATIVEIVKGMVTDEPAHPGESRTVEL